MASIGFSDMAAAALGRAFVEALAGDPALSKEITITNPGALGQDTETRLGALIATVVVNVVGVGGGNVEVTYAIGQGGSEGR